MVKDLYSGGVVGRKSGLCLTVWGTVREQRTVLAKAAPDYPTAPLPARLPVCDSTFSPGKLTEGLTKFALKGGNLH